MQWVRQRYGAGETCFLGPGMTLSVYWEGIMRLPAGEPGYNVVVFGEVLPGRSATVDEGKDRAVAEAISRLAAALRKLES